MAKEDAIESLAEQLSSVAGRIRSLSCGMRGTRDKNPGLFEDYETFLLDEAAHVQILALALTHAVTDGMEQQGGPDGKQEP